MIRFEREKSLKWIFVIPNAQHQNGAAEIMIKPIKGAMKSLMKTLGSTIFSLNKLNTLFLEVANLMNEIPIGMKPIESTDPVYLSPKSLYLGCCSDRISSGPFQECSKGFRNWFLHIQSIIDQF